MNILQEIDKFKSLDNLYKTVQEKGLVSLTNVKGGLQGFIALSVFNQVKQDKRDTLLITPTDADARSRYNVLSRYTDDIIYLPPEQIHNYFSDAFSTVELRERQQALKKVLGESPNLVICSLEALLKKLPEPLVYEENEVHLKVGEDFGYEKLINILNSFGYERSYQTEAPGQYSVRGEIIDVFLSTENQPIRIDFFDDEIESIHYFDLDNQRSLNSIDEITIFPQDENWLPQELKDKALKELENRYKNNKTYEERFDMVTEGIGSSSGILFSFLESQTSFLDYLKEGSEGQWPVIVWSNPPKSKEEANDYLGRAIADYKALSVSGEAFTEEINRFFTVPDIIKRIKECPLIELFLFSDTEDNYSIDIDSNTVESFAGQPKLLSNYLQDKINDGYFIYFLARNQHGLDKLKNYLNEIGIKEISEDDQETPGVRFAIGEITEGFELPKDKLVFLNESDFFKAPKRKRSKKKENTRRIDHFTELKVGDYVVHDEHGIGKYKGITQMDFGGGTKDMMYIEYANDGALYIPVEQMDLIQVYIGTGDTTAPALNELGTKKWSQTKKRAKKAAEDMADELIALYSKREHTPGYAFSPDTVWQRDFEEAFPFEETDDQLQSIEEIKKDMESTVAMDRLLCGDVGYGKTEVAFRAAFKAAMEGKQTAILVPTTVLAQQHYLSAVERFKDFPVNVEVLSRFKSAKEQRETLQRLKDGLVDIVIGTHRLLSNDVEFNDLGLLIVDEEQRFGVRSKERIKQLKENVDVLTLSATPIPRTLHMSLSGVRDMSVLEEPPIGRRPVQTYVMKYNEPVIKDAIERELARGGQVYYIHNRVNDIDEISASLAELVPEARIVSAHGRMNGKELENIMSDFLEKKYDVLVATTIVENGLDVRNANTMIVEEGDHYGLSQLYQLRGRVGRSPKQAYTYITHKKEILNEDAAKRLKAIRDFTAFGSGFKIAMRDLEIRGAGNILGSAQSGHMVKIGYELYTRILQDAINEKLTGKVNKTHKEATIQIDTQAYIPKGYIIGDELKYDIYRKLAHLSSWNEFRDLEDELKDRFGKIPQSVYNLMLTAMIKNVASKLDIINLRYRDGVVRLSFLDNDAAAKAAKAEMSLKQFRIQNLKLNAGTNNRPAWTYASNLEGYDLLESIYDFLSKLLQAKQRIEGDQ